MDIITSRERAQSTTILHQEETITKEGLRTKNLLLIKFLPGKANQKQYLNSTDAVAQGNNNERKATQMLLNRNQTLIQTLDAKK